MLIRALFIAFLNAIIYYAVIFYSVVIDDRMLSKLGVDGEPSKGKFRQKRQKVISTIIHTLVCEYIYLAFGANLASFWAALLFSVHPLTVQVTCWWCGRHYGINALMILMAIAFAPFGAVLYFLSVGTFATALFTPLMFVFTKHWYIAFMFPVMAFMVYKPLKLAIASRAKNQMDRRHVGEDDYKAHEWQWRNLILVVKTFGYYALASLLPIKNGFYNPFMVEVGASEKATRYWYSINRHFWGGILAMLIMAVAWAYNIHNYIGMGILLFILSIGPYLNFISVQQRTAPRYAYAALAGFQFALAGLLAQLGTPGYCMLSALWLYYFDRMIFVRKRYKKDDVTLITEDSKTFPDNPRLYYFLYQHMLYQKNFVMAWAMAAIGLKDNPEDSQLYFGLACASYSLGDINAAKNFLDLSEKFMILTERKSMEKLIREFREKIEKETKK